MVWVLMLLVLLHPYRLGPSYSKQWVLFPSTINNNELRNLSNIYSTIQAQNEKKMMLYVSGMINNYGQI